MTPGARPITVCPCATCTQVPRSGLCSSSGMGVVSNHGLPVLATCHEAKFAVHTSMLTVWCAMVTP